MDIAVVGSNMVDLISYITRMSSEGETVEAPDFRMGCGGKGASQAVAASRLGSQVLMVTRIGNDMFAENTIKNFAANGIDIKYVMRTEATSGVAPIFVDSESRNSILIVRGANVRLCSDGVMNVKDAIVRCKIIVMQLETPLETVYVTTDLTEELNIPVLLSPTPADPALQLEKVKRVEFIVPNESELSLLTGMSVDTHEDIINAAYVLLDAGIPNVTVTLGSKGAVWISSSRDKTIPATSAESVDSTGAGDAFIGCFNHMRTKTEGIEASIVAANKYVGDSVTKRGTQTSYAKAGDTEF